MTSASKWVKGAATERLGLGVRGGARKRKEAYEQAVYRRGKPKANQHMKKRAKSLVIR